MRRLGFRWGVLIVQFLVFFAYSWIRQEHHIYWDNLETILWAVSFPALLVAFHLFQGLGPELDIFRAQGALPLIGLSGVLILTLWYPTGLWIDRRLGLVSEPLVQPPGREGRVLAWLTLGLLAGLTVCSLFWGERLSGLRLGNLSLTRSSLILAAWFGFASLVLALRIRRWCKLAHPSR